MKLAGFLIALMCTAALLASGQDDSSLDVKSKIVALEKAWNQAYKLGDRKALDSILDDQLVLVNDDGSIQSKSEFLASIRPTNTQEQQVTPESISVRVFGSAAIATGIFREKGPRAANPTFGASASLTPGSRKATSGNAPPRMQ